MKLYVSVYIAAHNKLPVSVNKNTPFTRAWPRSHAAEAAIQPLIWRSGSLQFHVFSSPEKRCFSQTPVYVCT